MATQPISYLSPEEYLEFERAAEFRHEYVNGEMFAMSGGTLNHARIARNALRQIEEQAGRCGCEAVGSDLRLFSSARNCFVYPDIVVVCGAHRFLDQRRDTITDATAIVEILSPSTRNYDRGEKFLLYRSLPSFTEYLLISQDQITAEHYARQPDHAWLLREHSLPTDQIELKSIGCTLPLGSLYERVEF